MPLTLLEFSGLPHPSLIPSKMSGALRCRNPGLGSQGRVRSKTDAVIAQTEGIVSPSRMEGLGRDAWPEELSFGLHCKG